MIVNGVHFPCYTGSRNSSGTPEYEEKRAALLQAWEPVPKGYYLPATDHQSPPKDVSGIPPHAAY